MQFADFFKLYKEFGIEIVFLGGVLFFLYRLMLPDNIEVVSSLLSRFRKKSRLRNLLKDDFLSPEARTRVKLELNQLNNMWLTGMLKPGIAEAAVILTIENNLRARYLYGWRVWLYEKNGRIIFDGQKYKKFLCINYSVGILVGLLTTLFIIAVYYQGFYPEFSRGAFPAAINLIVLWVIIFMAVRVPGKKATLQMKRYIERYNNNREVECKRRAGLH
ncbi:hypothetical protein [Escherichia coli]|uniref:hypothetical protein n=1 Tax=Escherichia coli TaxID=562 RepID=UPI0006A5EF15|nr:hypothetical protein [Escherichia coli]MCZ9148914.1 hypothetical protein [Escherichia albertii]GDA27924.1 hypothetical protein HmCmsJML130_02291 [Escherichia coli]HCQ0339685.1 hypothetical protein [Escherichia coli]HDV9719982.1 hypothetical protein [Escherichia coli]